MVISARKKIEIRGRAIKSDISFWKREMVIFNATMLGNHFEVVTFELGPDLRKETV